MEIVGVVSIIGLVAIVLSQQVIYHKERIEMEKLKKAKDIDDVKALETFEVEGGNPILEEDNLIDLAEMPDLPFQDKKEGE
jgi:hypothetical protein